ncbi:MAG TPA: hypothetical protein PKA56_06220 [Solirubrobacterales bacterium]|mgnify:CR=1 FL=1|jgi:hypothetical protein|nr:hypothetical protein [Solirubrobacterales bacterium]MCB0856702.1 hypothetical protein [Solirubrobacterales bacterium]HMU28430.1 hypothetical protein [Solirubrobacterales bacterium]HMX71333.1 hypothetical protein [Solirubrobacterales bacterium]HMY25901.1 hypothetical protein [Solirubrobacterales bacterium]
MDPEDDLVIFPREDVEACLRNEKMQQEANSDGSPSGQSQAMETSRLGAIEAGAPERIRWIYFESPEWTWQNLCGRSGWLLIDPETIDQYDFVMTMMN